MTDTLDEIGLELLQRVLQEGRWDNGSLIIDGPWVISAELQKEIKKYVEYMATGNKQEKPE